MQDLFRRLQQRTSTGEEHTVKLSYLEVYNETVKDLLAPGRPLVLRDGEQVRLRSQEMLLGCGRTC
jgi:kinesin family protein 18/19